jgi:hypothetical protein
MPACAYEAMAVAAGNVPSMALQKKRFHAGSLW